MVGFNKYNANPKGRKTGDCVIRAISRATGKHYNDVVMDLAQMQIQTGYDDASKECYDKYLKEQGWIKHKQPRYEDGTKYLVGDIYRLTQPYQRVIITMAGHMTVKDGEIQDTWDCRRKTISNYYTHPDDDIR